MKKYDLETARAAAANPALNPAAYILQQAPADPVPEKTPERTPVQQAGGEAWERVRPARETRSKRFQLYTTPSIDEALRAKSRETGAPVNELINAILAAALNVKL